MRPFRNSNKKIKSCIPSPSFHISRKCTGKLLYPQEKQHCNGVRGLIELLFVIEIYVGCPKHFVEDFICSAPANLKN